MQDRPIPLRILHVLTVMDYGGTEALLMTFYRQIDREKIQFDFAVSTKREGKFDKEILSMGGHIFHYPLYKVGRHRAYTNWWNSFITEHPEHQIIHGHIGSTASIYLSIAKRHGRFCIAHSHNTKATFNLSSVLYQIYSYPTRYIAHYFFGCSRQALIDRFGNRVANNPSKASVLKNAINARKYIYDESARKAIRKELHLQEGLLVIGTVGRLTPQKNPLMNIQVANELAKRKINFKFIWVGKGEMASQIKSEINAKGLNEYFIFLGTRPDVNRVLQAMDVFLFPSIYEGLGIACIEAQASGLPTLCSEAIPIDAKITNNFKYLPLDDVQPWVDTIMAVKDAPRLNRYQVIVDAGYDIESECRWLQDFYLKAYKEQE